MSLKAGIWIDHRQAFIVYLEGEEAKSRTIVSNIEKRISGAKGSRTSTPYGPQDVFAEDRADRKYRQNLDKYYEKIIKAISKTGEIFVIGPGEAKEEFKKHLEKTGKKPLPAITVEACDKMTEAQIIAKVKDHFLK